jgi:hypothetical protein
MRTLQKEVTCQLRYLYSRRSRLDAAIRLLEQVVMLRRKRPPIAEKRLRRKVA